MRRPLRTTKNFRGFTLVELMVSMVLIVILLVLLVSITNQTSATWRYTTGKVEQFREAREAFEAVTRRLSQATLNTYFDYQDASGKFNTEVNSTTFVPAKYGRNSELHFQSGRASTLLGGVPGDRPTHAVFFEAPIGYTDTPTSYPGLGNLLNTCGYYIQYGPDQNKPAFIGGAVRKRFRLMEFIRPSEKLEIYANPEEWISKATGSDAHSIAENIIALVITPKLSSQEDATGAKISPDYAYDSLTNGVNGSDKNYNTRNQLPPVVQVTMVAVDETSAALLDVINKGNNPNLVDDKLFGGSSANGVTNYDGDLKTLQAKLAANAKINYRIFTSQVRIRGAKWSRE